MSQRLASLHIQSDVASSRYASVASGRREDDDVSTIRHGKPKQREHRDLDIGQTIQLTFAFDNDLQDSRVYRRTQGREPHSSLTSTIGCSIGWSFLSGLSLADISCLSVISLPISVRELWKPSHYESRDVKPDVEPSYFSDLSGAVITKRIPVKVHSTRLILDPLSESSNALRLCQGCEKVLLEPMLHSPIAASGFPFSQLTYCIADNHSWNTLRTV